MDSRQTRVTTMHKVDLTCARCGAHISELPFEPTEGRPVYCAECNRAHFQQRRQRRQGGRRYQVNVKCASCGRTITELPFEPRNGAPVYCRDCYRQQRDK